MPYDITCSPTAYTSFTHMSLQDCSDFTVNGDVNNTVNGNQYNASVMHFSQKKKECTEYDEFEEVKRGHVYTLKRLHTKDLSTGRLCEWVEREEELFRKPISAQRTICTVQVRPDQQNKYTAVIYEGKDAHLAWKEDFEHLSCAGIGTPETWQLYGLNRSKIPLLIFHNELIPLANFHKKSFWGDLYLWLVQKPLGCFFPLQIWLDTKGNLCKGLWGPVVEEVLLAPSAHIYVRSTSVQMLQSDDICVELLQQSSSSQLDRIILFHANRHGSLTSLDDVFPEPTNCHLRLYCPHFHWIIRQILPQTPLSPLTPDMFDGLRFDTVYSTSRGAVARRPSDEFHWEVYHWRHGLVNEMKVGDGLIRVKLDDPQDVSVSFNCAYETWKGWLVQSSRIMDAHEMSGMEETCFVVEPPSLKLSALARKPSLTVKNLPPIYLFIYPPPLSISELRSWKEGLNQTHYWSLDENGRSEMSEEERRRWGVPELQLDVKPDLDLQHWPAHIYTALRKWQVACSFNPTTSNWAQSLGYPKWEIVGGKEEEARFEGVRDWYSYNSKLREQGVELQLGPVRRPSWSPVTLTTRRRSWPATRLPNWHVRRVTSGCKCTTCNPGRTQSVDDLELEITDAEKKALLKKFQDNLTWMYPFPTWDRVRACRQLQDIISEHYKIYPYSDDGIQSPEDTPGASPSDEQGDLPPPEQNEPLSAQETPKEEAKSSSWWSWEALAGSGISACM